MISVSSVDVAVHVMVTTQQQNLRLLETNLHRTILIIFNHYII
jgi:hypothetical protein